jgi:hypothetical protein
MIDMKGVSEKLMAVMKTVIIADIVTLVGGVTYLTVPTTPLSSSHTASTAVSASVSADYTGAEVDDSSSESAETNQPIQKLTIIEDIEDIEKSVSSTSDSSKPEITEEDIVYTVYKDETSSELMPEEPPQVQAKDCWAPIPEAQPAGTVITPPYWWSDTRMSYMDWRTITDPTSEQWALQQQAYTDSETGIRMVDGRYCVAVGSYVSIEKGALLNVTLQNGVIIPCILADCKQDCDTIDTLVGADGGIVEFVVTTEMLPGEVQLLGSNEAQFNYMWQSPVESIFLYDSTGEVVW